MEAGGFFHVNEILVTLPAFRDVTFNDIKEVVDTNAKKRFTLRQSGDHWLIGANQGHSFDVELECDPVLSDDGLPRLCLL